MFGRQSNVALHSHKVKSNAPRQELKLRYGATLQAPLHCAFGYWCSPSDSECILICFIMISICRPYRTRSMMIQTYACYSH